MAETVDTRNYNDLQMALELAQYTVYKKYLNELSAYPLVEPGEELLQEKTEECIRAFQLKELTCKKGEDIFQKLSTVYHASMSLGCSLFVMIDVECIGAPAKIYLGIRDSEGQKNGNLTTSYNALTGGMKSNFPGTVFSNISASQELPAQIKDIFSAPVRCISSVSGVASIRNKDKTENKDFIQGLEKLIDAMQGHTYTALFIADPVTPQEQSEIRNGYESLYSTLSAFQKSIWSYNENQSKAVMESLSKGISDSVTEGVSQTQSHTKALTEGKSNSANLGVNVGMNRQNTTGISNSHTEGVNKTRASMALKASRALEVIALMAPVGAAAPVMLAIAEMGRALTEGDSISKVLSNTIAESVGKSLGLNAGLNAGYSHGWSNSQTDSEGNSSANYKNSAHTTSQTKTSGTTETRGAGRTLQIENINKPIVELLKRIEEQLKRVQEGEDYGAYNCGAYFLSSKEESSILAANTYRALMLGEGTAIESGAINTWTDEKIVPLMKEYLKRFEQPIFAFSLKNEIMVYSAGTIVSGLELPLHLGIPTKSIVGLPVIEHAEFGRNVKKPQNAIELGKLYHMGQETGENVELEMQSFASHTFVTGSTGSGKSNAVYQLLEQLERKKVKFLVIEPAKGEYKNVFGGRKYVSVYGTNVKQTKLLQINPFSFPEGIHVLEHIDRLVEIFNACWPMYAAMPAVLKDAVERVYRNCGWDMEDSVCNPKVFPTFRELMQVLPEVVKESNYSADTQSDYIGALYTRIKSLTNGINGQIFCSKKELEAEQLFDENVIVDLSRVGSGETKSLLMGILVMKLQEHRMEYAGMNAELQHVTILEEAHNLLRCTSNVQTQEGSNLQGKSVEMISNAIAEMRTYGEGFIIADQAPALLDSAVIRNTNTKIILRLPDEEDRQLVGKAASLNEDQIAELAKLPLGTAAIYQNDWLEPVLCKMKKFEKEQPYRYQPQIKKKEYLTRFFHYLYGVSDQKEFTDGDVEKVKEWIDTTLFDVDTKRLLWKAASRKLLSNTEKKVVSYNLFEGKKIAEILDNAYDETSAIKQVDTRISAMYHIEDIVLAKHIREIIVDTIVEQLGNSNFERRYVEFAGKRIK